MEKLKLLWLAPQVQYKGKDIITAWGEEMQLLGFDLTHNPDEADLIFFGSDSQLKPNLLGKKPTICYFWGWMPERMLDKDFRKHAETQLDMVARCTRVLVPAPCVYDQITQFGIPCQICFPGVDIRTLDKVPPAQRIAKILFISRLVPYKRLDTLIAALGMFNNGPPLTVIGPGDTAPYANIAKQLNVNIKFMEATDEEKASELQTSAVLVHPSMYEGLGLAPLEALAVGTPIIVYDTPHNRWLFQENAYYFSSIEGLAGTIKDIFANHGEAVTRASQGAQMVRNVFTLQKAAERMWAHVHQVIKEELAMEIRRDPGMASAIYDKEHKRNWAYGQEDVAGYHGPARFDPTWERHWRAQHVLASLKECNAQNIIDIGSGAVYPTIFARNGFKVEAVDVSKEALRQVKVIAEKWNVADKITVNCQNAAKLPYPDNTFDAAVQGELWEHVKYPSEIIKEALRVIKPGGYLIASTPCGEHHDDPMHLTHWNDNLIKEITSPYNVKKLEKIAEEGTDPSCYFIVLQK